MWQRLYPKFVTLLGGVGLGLALTYLVGVILALLPGWEDWADFFVPLALYFLIPPYVILLVYMVLRNHVGRYLLRRGAYEEALEYTESRMNQSLWRSRRELANHRVVHARALVALGDYEGAEQLVVDDYEDFPGAYGVEARRWLCEIALRRDDRAVAAAYVVVQPDRFGSARGELAALMGCGAELALRDGDRDGYKTQMENALWEDASHPRVRLARALAMIDSKLGDNDASEAAGMLQDLEEPIGLEIPARTGELKALRALAHWRSGEEDEARRLLEQARAEPGDDWTEQVIDQVAEAHREG